jgi:hypothetical protein
MTRSLPTYWGRPRFKTLQRDFRAAVRANSGEAARAACTRMGLSHLLLPVFPEKHIRLLCSLIRSAAFARSPEAAGAILAYLTTDSHKVSLRQERRLLKEFERIYPKVTTRAWYVCFSISEFVGSNFHNRAALEMFIRLVDVSRPRTRASVAHGLEHIVCDSDNPSLAAPALQALKSLAADPAETVRMQVEESLSIIERRGSTTKMRTPE